MAGGNGNIFLFSVFQISKTFEILKTQSAILGIHKGTFIWTVPALKKTREMAFLLKEEDDDDNDDEQEEGGGGGGGVTRCSLLSFFFFLDKGVFQATGHLFRRV
jgi:hypothetical protein